VYFHHFGFRAFGSILKHHVMYAIIIIIVIIYFVPSAE
jgi:hypothetical protein